MAGQRGFFSWWFGELREVFSGRPVPVHALALSDHEIALIEKGVDTPLGVVDIDAPDRVEQIEGLRSRLVGRRGRNPVIEVQLPSEQVMFSKVDVPQGGDLNEAVKAQLGDLTGHNPDELEFDIAVLPRSKNEVVAGIALTSTIDEAVTYASKWGFEPVRVTSIESPQVFRRGPDFRRLGTKRVGSNLPKFAAGLAVLTLVLGTAAAVRALSVRADLAQEAREQGAKIAPPLDSLDVQELALAEFAHSASMASDERNLSMPVWRILAETATTLPADVILSAMRYEAGQLRLAGSAGSIEALSESMERSAIFSAPYFSETSAQRGGQARFVMDVTVDERNIR